MKDKAHQQILFNAFMDLAKDNYDKSMGWSVFTECYSEDEIIDFVSDIGSVSGVSQLMEDLASIWDDRYHNARVERGE